MKEMTLNCREAEVLMQDYLDGALLSHHRESLERHLAVCEACDRQLIELKRLEAEFETEFPMVDPPAELAGMVMSRLPAGYQPSFWSGRTVRYVGMALAACLLVSLSFMLGSRNFIKGSGVREVELVFSSPGARNVSVAGDFNSWDTSSHRMEKGRDGNWRLSMQLPAGVYQYNFYIDDKYWSKDPGNGEKVVDGFGGRNALLFIEG